MTELLEIIDKKVNTIIDNMKPQYYTKKEVAKILKTSIPTINNWMRDGKITFKKAGGRVLFSRADIESVLE